MSEEPDRLDAALARLSEINKNYLEAVRLARQAIIDSLYERGYTDAQIAEMAWRRPRQRRRKGTMA